MRALVACVLLAGCSREFTPPSDTLVLPIADRRWEPGAPEEGWCGETSIQLAAGWYGAYVSQAKVNALGHPKTPDLWEHDVPVALEALQLTYERGPSSRVAALKWVVEQLRLQRPIVLGLKLPPTEHLEWNVDHLVLAVGFSPEGLRINTNAEEGQIAVTWAGLQSLEGDRGYSLVNQSGEVFAYAVQGFVEPSLPVRVRIVEQRPAIVRLEVMMTGLVPGSSYELRVGNDLVEQFVAQSPERARPMTVATQDVFRFSVRAAAAK